MALPGRPRAPIEGPQGARPRADPAVAAVEDLYRACHLRPPAVLAARDAVHFGRLVGRLARPFGFMQGMAGLLLTGLALSVLTVPTNGAPAAIGAIYALFLVPWILAADRAHRGNAAVVCEALLRMLASLLIGAAAFGAARLVGAEHKAALRTTGIAMGAGACAQLLLVLLAPCLNRWRLVGPARAGGAPIP
ncbi:MAG TPA: hypothetical protein VE650_03245 [Acetobacteraceae bacterium]|nr:hypothetical protein [Acetobacteraceae bacterium]